MGIVTVNMGFNKRLKFKIETKEDEEILDRAREKYRREHNGDNRDFINNFLGFHPTNSSASTYICGLKSGVLTMPLDHWNEIKNYVSDGK